MSKRTKAGRRESFKRWAKGRWPASGSDLVASREPRRVIEAGEARAEFFAAMLRSDPWAQAVVAARAAGVER